MYVYNIIRGVQTRLWPAGPTNPPDLHPISVGTDAPTIGFGFPHPRPNAGWSSGGFSSPKPKPPDPTEVIYNSGKIKLKSEEIQQVLNHIWWDLARSSHSQQISAILVQILVILIQIWWVFTFFDNDFADSGNDFAALATTQNRPNIPDLHLNPKPTWPIDAGG